MDLGLMMLRFTVGAALAAHGAQKVFGWFGGYGPDATGQFMEALGFRPGRRHALAAGYAELLGGLLLAIGLVTPLAAAVIVSVMLVAAATVHWKNGFFVTNGGIEFNVILGVAALSLAFTGPGAWSVDHALGFAPSGALWGVGAALVAIVGALGQLAQRHLPAVERSAHSASGA